MVPEAILEKLEPMQMDRGTDRQKHLKDAKYNYEKCTALKGWHCVHK